MSSSGPSSYSGSLQVRAAENETDVKFAMKVATATFDTDNDQGPDRKFLWRADPDFSTQDILIAKTDNNNFAGVVRFVPLTICSDKRHIRAVIFTDICIAGKLRGQGLSVPMLQSAVEIAKQRKFDFAVLFARRAVDHFYNRFSFWGASSYSSVELRSLQPLHGLGKSATLGNHGKDLIELYDRSYRSAYKNCFGRIDRSPEYWDYAIERIRRRGIAFNTVQVNGTPVGYVVHSGTHIHEIATQDTADLPSAILAVMGGKQENGDVCRLSITHEHAGFKYLSGSDLTVSHRECLFGGHMVRALNTIPSPGSHKAATVSEEYSYEETLKAFGASRAHDPSSAPEKRRPFNISLLDEV